MGLLLLANQHIYIDTCFRLHWLGRRSLCQKLILIGSGRMFYLSGLEHLWYVFECSITGAGATSVFHGLGSDGVAHPLQHQQGHGSIHIHVIA